MSNPRKLRFDASISFLFFFLALVTLGTVAVSNYYNCFLQNLQVLFDGLDSARTVHS